MTIKLTLIDDNFEVVHEWRKAFNNYSEVEIIEGNILDHAQNTVVSPANCSGHMDGGIDAIYTKYFGPIVQNRVQENISMLHENKLEIGRALIVKTNDTKIKYLISAPTMDMPGPIPKENVFLAFTAVLNCALTNKNIVEHIFCPGLGSGVGHVLPELVAQEMLRAYTLYRGRLLD